MLFVDFKFFIDYLSIHIQFSSNWFLASCFFVLKQVYSFLIQEQLSIVQSEKAKVEQECSGLHTQLLDVRHISRRVNELNQKLDASTHLIEPRENSFLSYDADSSGFVMDSLSKVLSEFGSLRISKTFPPLCTLKADSQVKYVQSVKRLILVKFLV